MYSTYEHYSSGFAGRARRGLVRKLFKLLIATLILYLVISSMFLAAFQVESGSMEPLLEPRDRILVSPLIYGARILFFSARLPAVREPGRGDIVVIRSPLYSRPKLPLSLFEPLIRFFSFQRGSVVRDESGRRIPAYMVKRIVAVPGDTVRISGFIAYIRPENRTEFVAEQELIAGSYELILDSLPEGWAKEFPFSGERPPVTLGKGQYFLLGDNRQGSSDSRSWGPVARDQIVGRVIFRYWPLPRSGRL
ncbi:MAG: signal peptidase I [Spirochaetales bacterium]|nr:signal peptidase I [Spirochaetales bacterium]